MTGPRDDRERGSIAVELSLIMPLLLLLLALVYGYAQVAQVNGTLEAGTRDAARAASQARSAEQAQQVAERAVLSSLGPGSCRDSAEVVLRDGSFRPGFPVTVDAECSYRLTSLSLFVRRPITVSSSFTSPLDPNRGVR